MSDTTTPIIKPREIIPDSGIYQDIQTGQRATLVKGEQALPTQERGSAWLKIIDTQRNHYGSESDSCSGPVDQGSSVVLLGKSQEYTASIRTFINRAQEPG